MKEHEFFAKTVDVRKSDESPLQSVVIITQDNERLVIWVGAHQARLIAGVPLNDES